MVKVRWIAALAALIAGLVVALVAAPAGVATTTSAPCLLLCATTTTATTTPTAPTQASAGVVGVATVTATSAAFSAGFNPGTDGAAYRFQVLIGNTVVTSAPYIALPAGMPATEVSYSASGLTPNQAYRVQLSYYDTATGSPQAPSTTAATAFTTPIEPAAVPALAASAKAIVIGQSLTLTGTASANPIGSGYVLQDAIAPSEHFSDYFALANGPAPVTGLISTGATDIFSAVPTHNMRLRLLLPGLGSATHSVQLPSVSPSVFVYVFPQEGVTVSRPHNNQVNEIAAKLTVHTVPAGFRGEYVSFYRSATKRGIKHRIGRVRLRWLSNGPYGVSYIGADLEFSDPDTSYLSACIRHAALADMGTPFTDAACGRPTMR